MKHEHVALREPPAPPTRSIGERFAKEKPLKGVKIAACLHVTTETAALMQVLSMGGAKLTLCASNPLSTQDAAAASLVHADDETIAARALELGFDERRLRAHVVDARRRLPAG